MAKHGIKYWQEDYRRRGKTLTDAQIQSLLDNRLANEDRDPYEIMLWKGRMGSDLSGVEQGSSFKPPKVETGRGTAGSGTKGQAYGPRVDYGPQDLTPMPTEKIQKAPTYTGVSDAERFKRFQLKREDEQSRAAFEKGFSSVFSTGGKGSRFTEDWVEKTRQAQKKAADRNATDFWVDLQNDQDSDKWVPYKALDGTLYRNGEKVGYEPPTDLGDGMAWPTKEEPMAASDFLAIYSGISPEEVETMLRDGRLMVDPGFDLALYNRDAQAKRQAKEDRKAALDGMPEEGPIQKVSEYLKENPGASNAGVVLRLDNGELVNDTMINFHQAAANDVMDWDLEKERRDQNDTDRQLADYQKRLGGYVAPLITPDRKVMVDGRAVGIYDPETGAVHIGPDISMAEFMKGLGKLASREDYLRGHDVMREEFDIVNEALYRRGGLTDADWKAIGELAGPLMTLRTEGIWHGRRATDEEIRAGRALEDIIAAIPSDNVLHRLWTGLNTAGYSLTGTLGEVENWFGDGPDENYHMLLSKVYEDTTLEGIDDPFLRTVVSSAMDLGKEGMTYVAALGNPFVKEIIDGFNSAAEASYAIRMAGGSEAEQNLGAMVSGLTDIIFSVRPWKTAGDETVFGKGLAKALKEYVPNMKEELVKGIIKSVYPTLAEAAYEGLTPEEWIERIGQTVFDALVNAAKDSIDLSSPRFPAYS